MADMVDRLILVNGLPASGKTTLATELAAHLSVPLISKDHVKEMLADAFPAVPHSSLGRIAMDTAWSLVAGIPGTVILDSWWFRPRDLEHAKAALARCCAATVVEIWCEVPADVARLRYAGRVRHPVHRDPLRVVESWSEWAAGAEPLDVALTLRIPTDRPIDIATVAAGVLGASGGHEF